MTSADYPYKHYRDKDKRRAYMRDLMRRRRAAKNANVPVPEMPPSAGEQPIPVLLPEVPA